jgi:hypothetical protein
MVSRLIVGNHLTRQTNGKQEIAPPWSGCMNWRAVRARRSDAGYFSEDNVKRSG